VISIQLYFIIGCCTVDVTEFFIEKLSVVIQSLLELGGNEYDNLNFMNFKTDGSKICEF